MNSNLLQSCCVIVDVRHLIFRMAIVSTILTFPTFGTVDYVAFQYLVRDIPKAL